MTTYAWNSPNVEEETDVHFAHARGFIAKTSSAEVDRLKELVSLAYRKV